MLDAQLDSMIKEHFPDVCVDKRLSRQIGGSDRAIPDFVSDWLVSRYTVEGAVDKAKVARFLSRHLPDKKQKNSLLYDLNNAQTLKILDAYNVRVDVEANRLILDVPSLDISNATVLPAIVDAHPLLLMGNVWGSGTLVRHPREDSADRYEIRMVDFTPMQTSKVDLDYFLRVRKEFTVRQWRDMLVRTMGYDPGVYSSAEQVHLLTRLSPMVQPRVNLIELAPKGTGKSYVFSQLSRHAWLISGGIVTRAQMFYNMSTRTAGVVSRYDVVVLDEVQTIRFSNEGEIVGALKGYLEQGEFRVMQYKGTADASFALLANIPLTGAAKPRDQELFRTLPNWLQGAGATALLDRFHGLLPGWELRKISQDCLCDGMTLRADYFGEVLHELRQRDEYRHWAKEHMRSSGNIRDINSVERLATAFLKILFPDLSCVTPDLFREYCLTPAKQLRQRIRSQMALVDEEYAPELAEIEVWS